MPGSFMLRGNVPQKQSQQGRSKQQQRSYSIANRRLQNGEVPTPDHKNPLNPDKDAAVRPFDPESFFKGTDSFQERPSRISYFPDQVIQLSYVVSVMQPTATITSRSNGNDSTTETSKSLSLSNSLYLGDLKEALDILATELAPTAYPQLWVRELTTSVDGWFSVVCPADTNLSNCQDITSSIGIYLSNKPNSGNTFDDSTENLEDATVAGGNTKKIIDPGTLTSELKAFQVALEEAISNNRLQEIVESFYNDINGEPPVYVIPNGVSSVIVSGGESNEESNENNSNNPGEANESGSDTDSATQGNESNNNADENSSSGSTNDSDNSENNPASDDNDGTENIQIGNNGSGESEFTPETGNEVVVDENAEDDSNSGSWLPGPNENAPSTTVGEDTLPAINDNTLVANSTKNALSIGGVIGIVVAALAAILVVVSLVYLRRPSKKSRKDGQRSSRYPYSPSKHKGKQQTKSLPAKVDDDDIISSDSSKKSSLGRFLYSGVQVQTMLASSHSRGGTDHSRGTVPTVTSTMSENTDGSISSAAANGGRGSESWKKDEVLVPVNTSRGLLTLDSVDEEKRSEDGDDDCDPLLASNKSSELYLAPTSSSELEMQAKKRLGATSDDDEVYNSDSAGSSGWSSNASPSTVESPLKAMAARSIAALRGGRRGSRTRSIQRSQQDLENVLSSGIMRSDEQDLELVDRVALNESHLDADDEGSPVKSKESGTKAIYSPGITSADGSFNSPLSDVRPLSSLDEAIMKGDWAAVGATAALMAASISPEEKKSRSSTRRPSLNSPPPEKRELDRLIEQGDWQAVMEAAARYDADASGTISTGTGEEGSRSARSRSSTQGSDTMDGSYYSGAEYSSGYNSTVRGSVATSGSQKERVQEIRAHVERLVREVVPDEVENVDEMMTQFKGKEEELLETLRTMKERDVAKKARLEAHKIARRNTRSKEKGDELSQGRDPSTSSVEATGEPPSDSDDDSDFSPKPASTPTSGSFAQATKGDDRDAAAAAAAEWAIERSLSELMEKEQAGAASPIKGEFV